MQNWYNRNMEQESTEVKPNVIGEKPIRDPKTGLFLPGNPGGGRPPGTVSVVEAIKRKLQEIPKDKQKTYLEYLVEALFQKAIIETDVVAMRDIINRVDGMPKQSTDLTTGGKPLFLPSEILDKNKLNETNNSTE